MSTGLLEAPASDAPAESAWYDLGRDDCRSFRDEDFILRALAADEKPPYTPPKR